MDEDISFGRSALGHSKSFRLDNVACSAFAYERGEEGSVGIRVIAGSWDVTAFPQTIDWNIAPTSVAGLIGSEAGRSEFRTVVGRGVGGAEVTVTATYQRYGSSGDRGSGRISRSLVVVPATQVSPLPANQGCAT